MTYPFKIERLASLQAAARRIADLQGRAAILGGGLELLDFARSGADQTPEILIPIRQIAPMSYIETRSGEIRIGAGTSIAEIADSTGIRRVAWPLTESANAVGSSQIRSQSTLAGNLLQRPRCWYFRNGISCFKNGGNTCPAATGDNRYHAIFGGGPTYSVFQSDPGLALCALQATLVIVSPDGERTMPVTDLYVDPKQDASREHVLKPGEIIREIRITPLTDRYVGTFMKIRERSGFDFATVSIALIYNNFHGRFKDIRVYLGGVAPRPYVPEKALNQIQYKKLGRGEIPPAADLAAEGAAPLEHNAYKIPMVKRLFREAFEVTYEKLSWRPD